MALLECPECQGRVSSTASVCPHCGHPRSLTPAIAAPPTHEPRLKGFWGWVLGIVCVAAVLNPRFFVPWSVKAESAAKRALSGNSGANVAASIQGIGHPTGGEPKLGTVEVRMLGDTLSATIPVRWTGGFLGGSYETVVEWRCQKGRNLGIRVLKDDAAVDIAESNLQQLQGYFQREVYDVVQANVGKSLW